MRNNWKVFKVFYKSSSYNFKSTEFPFIFLAGAFKSMIIDKCWVCLCHLNMVNFVTMNMEQHGIPELQQCWDVEVKLRAVLSKFEVESI